MAQGRTPIQDRIQGALWGIAVGDALGACQPSPPDERPGFPIFRMKVDKAYRPDERPYHQDLIAREGRLPGAVTEPTALAMALAAHLSTHGRVQPEVLWESYRALAASGWAPRSETAALLTQSAPPSPKAWPSAGTGSGGGLLIRASVIGLTFPEDSVLRLESLLEDALLTHPTPPNVFGAFLQGEAVAGFIRGLQGVGLVEACARALIQAGRRVVSRMPECEETVSAAVKFVIQDLDLAQRLIPRLSGERTAGALDLARAGGYLRAIQRLGLWHLIHAPDSRTALVDAVNRSPRPALQGAVTGAMVGARWGLSDLPKAWVDGVQAAARATGGSFGLPLLPPPVGCSHPS